MQKGTYECGFHVLRTMEIYCHAVEGEVQRQDREPLQTCREGALLPFDVPRFQVGIMQAIARELMGGPRSEATGLPYFQRVGSPRSDKESPRSVWDKLGREVSL